MEILKREEWLQLQTKNLPFMVGRQVHSFQNQVVGTRESSNKRINHP